MSNWREKLERALRAALESEQDVIAMWEGGSAAFGRADEWSDLDVQVLVDAESTDRTFAAIESALASVSPIALRFPAPKPTWHGHDQVFYRLRDCGEHLVVDVAVMRRGSPHQLSERERHGERIVWFDKTGEARATSLDRAAHERALAKRREQLAVSFPMFQSLTKKELLRENPIGAASFYFTHTLQPLLTLLRMRHCPDRFDFGPRYAKADLPPEVVRELEPLFFAASPEELGAKRARAEALFEAELAGRPLPPTSDSALREELGEYFRRYAAAYEAGDADRIAAFFHAPCLMVSEAGAAALASADAIRGNMRALVNHYRENQMVSAVPTLRSVSRPAAGLAIATVTWELERRAPLDPLRFGNTYNLIPAADGWKITVSTAHGA